MAPLAHRSDYRRHSGILQRAQCTKINTFFELQLKKTNSHIGNQTFAKSTTDPPIIINILVATRTCSHRKKDRNLKGDNQNEEEEIKKRLICPAPPLADGVRVETFRLKEKEDDVNYLIQQKLSAIDLRFVELYLIIEPPSLCPPDSSDTFVTFLAPNAYKLTLLLSPPHIKSRFFTPTR